MESPNQLFCKVFVDTDRSVDQLIALVAFAVAGTIKRSRFVTLIEAQGAEVDVRTNDDFDERLRHTDPDGFLYFRYYIEIDAGPNQRYEAQVALVARLLRVLWAHGLKAHCASCSTRHKNPLPAIALDADANPPARSTVAPSTIERSGGKRIVPCTEYSGSLEPQR